MTLLGRFAASGISFASRNPRTLFIVNSVQD
jgi:hypothetical protein